jgi:HemK-related putative methylase
MISLNVTARDVRLDEYPRVNRYVRSWTRFWLLLKRPFLLRRVRRHVVEFVNDVPLLILPEVLNPVVFRSGEYLARMLCELMPGGLATAGRALDMGTGSGIGAIFAARAGYRVVGIDINPEAVRCARINALLNRLDDRIEVRQGDLFGPVAGEQFDLILFNPPFFRGEPRDRLDMAWRSADVLERFAEGLPAALSPTGQALIVLSTDGDPAGLIESVKASGLAIRAAAARDFGNEIMTIYAVVHPATARASD